MRDIKEVRFIATNFFNLQGLRAVPLGLLLGLVSYWANVVEYPVKAASYLVPAVGVAVALLLLFVIDRYYLNTFGRVQRTPESRRLEWLVSAVGGILALGAFWMDTAFKLPVSLVGLVMAAGLLVDYIRITWLVKGRFLFYYPIGAVLMAGVSVLPLLGASNWWKVCGIRSQMLGVASAIAIFSMIAGIWGHLYLVRTLSSQGTQNDHAI